MGHLKSDENADASYKTIALLPIPSAFLSIFGSWKIIQMAFRSARLKGWTTYNRLLVAMSLCDILVSSHLAFAAFLKPQETSPQPWAVGNDVTCSFSGFMFQFTQASSFIYNTSLSFYFVLSTRARVNKPVMARRYEPWMHLMAIIFPLVTSITGLILDVYSEPVLGMSCWVNDYPKGCGNEDGQEECKSVLVGAIFGALPLFVAFVAFFANNWLIYSFVRRLTRRSNNSVAASKVGSGEEGQVESSTDFVGDEEIKEEEGVAVRANSPCRLDFTGQIREYQSSEPSPPAGAPAIQSKRDDFDISLRHSLQRGSQGSQTSMEEQQLRRLRLVQSQACLFVLAFFLTYIWSYVLYIMEAVAMSEEEEGELFFTTFELQVVRGIFLPLQGLFNMLVYARPKYLQTRHEFPEKSRLWAFQRAINGDSGDNSATFVDRQPIPPRPLAFSQKREDPNVQQTTKLAPPPPPPFSDKMTGTSPPLQRKQGPALRNISSITASVGDFSLYESGDSNFPGNTENARWVLTPEEQVSGSPIVKAKRYRSSTTLGPLDEEENCTLNERPTAPVAPEAPSPPADMSPRPPTRKKSPAVQTLSMSAAANNKKRYSRRAAGKSSQQRDGLPIRPTRYASVEEGAASVLSEEESCSFD